MSEAKPWTWIERGPGLRFRWWGGEYIEISFTGYPPIAFEVINVWGDGDRPRIDTREQFQAECQEWVRENADSLQLHRENAGIKPRPKGEVC